MKRMNSPAYKYTRTTTASRRAARPPRFIHVSVAFVPVFADGGVLVGYRRDPLRSMGTYRKSMGA